MSRLVASSQTGAHETAGASELDSRIDAEACRDVDILLEGLAQLSAAERSPEQFHREVLGRSRQQAGALGASIWLARDGRVERAFSVGDIRTLGGTSQYPQVENTPDERHKLIQRVIDLAQPRVVSHALPRGDGRFAANDNSIVSVFAPFFVEQPPAGAVELILADTATHDEQQRALSITVAIAELVGDYHRRHQLAVYRQREANLLALEQFLARLHRSNLHETAMALVNEGRWFCKCDRLSLVCRSSNTYKAVAVSGIDRVDSRSNLVRRMNDLAQVVHATSEAIWETGEATERPPQIQRALDAYLEESHARTLAAIPLRENIVEQTNEMATAQNAPVGVLVLEWFTPVTVDAPLRERVLAVARHGAIAVTNSLAIDRLPLIRVNRFLAAVRWLTEARQLPKTLWAAGGTLSLILALLIVPADFEVAAEGQLQPRERRQIFAPADGVVDEVFVEHGDDVALGAPLVRLRSSDLDLEKAKLLGEIQTSEKRLAAIRAARLETDADRSGTTNRFLQLTAEEEEVKETLKSLRQQEQILRQECAELDVRSPMAARVLSWDVARELAARPVKRGQPLLGLGNVAGSWVIELRVPDDEIGYVLSAHAAASQEGRALPVSILLPADTSVTYEGEVERIALRSQTNEADEEPVVLVTVRSADGAIEAPRPGASVVGKIDCGRRSLGFVWLHDAWNSIRRRVLF
jgi:multidrug efflux pump subunit AcrA (membrane-fusion protein)